MALLTSELLPTKTYPFSVLRHQSAREPAQEGVWGATDYQVVQRGAGANMSVDVGAGDAWVQGDDAVRQGLYHQINDATVNVTVGTAHATLPRIDQVVLQMADSSVLGASDTPALNVVAGTATSGATLDNRLGAGPLPNTALRLADILVPAAATQIVTANIRDRRPWARGFYTFIRRISADYTMPTTQALIDATNLNPRVECSGVPLRIAVKAMGNVNPNTFGGQVRLTLYVDGATSGEQQFIESAQQTTGNYDFTADKEWTITPAVGSHLIGVAGVVTGGTTTGKLYASGSQPLVVEIEEFPRQNATNGS